MPDPTLIAAPPDGGTHPNPQGGTPPATPNPSPAGFVKADGNFEDGWLDRLGDDLKPAHQTLAKYRSVQDFAKSHFELQQLLGKKSSAVNVPGEKSTPEDIAAFRKAIGAPEKFEDYKLKPEKLPEGIEWDEELGKGIAEIALKHNIPAAAMREITDRYLAGEVARGGVIQEMAQAEITKGLDTLKTEWGGNFEKNIGLAKRGAQVVGLDPNSPGLRDPEVVKALTRFASMMSEDKLVGGQFAPSQQVGKARANDIMTNKTNPLYEKYQNGDPETAKMVADLLKNG
jgi:hypothetical protein